MDTVSVCQAKAHFSELIDKVTKGSSVTITKHGKPTAKLIAANETKQKRELGFMAFPKLPESFFEPLPKDELELWGA
jgi:prevent-host-death family protein